MKARCVKLVDSRGNPVERSGWLDVGAVYHVLAVSMGQAQVSLRLIGKEPSTPALFALDGFEVVSSKIPAVWEIGATRPGIISLAPAEWNRPGFWDRFFDGEQDAIDCFERLRAEIVAADP